MLTRFKPAKVCLNICLKNMDLSCSINRSERVNIDLIREGKKNTC